MRILSVLAVVCGCLLLTPVQSFAQLGPKNPQPPKPAPAPAPPPAAAGAALSKVTPEQVASALTAAGYKAAVTSKNNNKFVTTKMHNFNVVVSFYGCDAQGCSSLQFTSWFSDKVNLEWVNAWNAKWRYAKADLDKDGDLEFSLDVLAVGGVTLENIKANGKLFDDLLDELTKFSP